MATQFNEERKRLIPSTKNINTLYLEINADPQGEYYNLNLIISKDDQWYMCVYM